MRIELMTFALPVLRPSIHPQLTTFINIQSIDSLAASCSTVRIFVPIFAPLLAFKGQIRRGFCLMIFVRATAEKFYEIANNFGFDYSKVIQVIAYEYPHASELHMPDFAMAPCLFEDKMCSSALVRLNFPLGHAAVMISEGTPGYLVSQLERTFDLLKMTVGV